ncbi:MAG TPA: acetyl-CoA carboxylase biotin carboxyl carrier protein subunit [Bacteroidales bacterium]|nr:acetyl-CoA carboxylase biotin carboxyl carrier protein subunit [Bacteroidales bacterium]
MSKTDKETANSNKKKPATVVNDFVVEFRPYTTELTQKFLDRKPWQPKDKTKIKSFIPGTIVKLFVKPGDQVDEEQPLMILEAMKMKNIIFSEISGVVKKIHAAEGDGVSKNKVIFEIKPLK